MVSNLYAWYRKAIRERLDSALKHATFVSQIDFRVHANKSSRVFINVEKIVRELMCAPHRVNFKPKTTLLWLGIDAQESSRKSGYRFHAFAYNSHNHDQMGQSCAIDCMGDDQECHA